MMSLWKYFASGERNGEVENGLKTTLGDAPELVNGNKLGFQTFTRLASFSKAEQIEMNHNGRRTLRHTSIRGN